METSKKTFEDKSFDENLPTLELEQNKLGNIKLRDILIEINFASSNSDYKRNFQNAAYKINNVTIDDENLVLSQNHFENNKVKISFGKKKHYLIKIK